ncbi:unnamed protein product [Trichogramma brassicae]|uniref:NADH dehydrogenase [ubiquinone] 1 subunit C2 n=1 Tax=Trichogramma brassicae TaxID=86971 RepID=A0A6H5IME6_9HYME|nr:unnamed protein product [Trichogramma brassicae]
MSTSDNPEIQWALDLLSPDPLYQENFISKNYHWITWPIFTVGGTLFLNYIQSRPFYASMPRHGLALGIGLTLAKVFRDAKYHREAERDAVLRHYIKLHPEDFIEPERKTWNDTLEAWYPCR